MNTLVTCWVLAPKGVLSDFFFYYCYFSFKKQDKTTYGIPTDLASLGSTYSSNETHFIPFALKYITCPKHLCCVLATH